MVRTQTIAPYQWGNSIEQDPALFGLTIGEYSLTLRATDQDGATFSASVAIEVVDSQVLELEFTSPSLDSKFEVGEALTVTVNASQLNGAITSVDLFYDDTLVRSERSLPYEWGFDGQPESSGVFSSLTAGEHTLKVVATAASGITRSISQSILVEAAPLPQVSLAVGQAIAYEKSQEYASFTLSINDSDLAHSIGFEISAINVENGLNSQASSQDYELVYSDTGEQVATTLELLEGQNERTIEVRPIVDILFEVPESVAITLVSGAGYQIKTPDAIGVTIVDARNIKDNELNFVGIFEPLDGVNTSASGVLSLVVKGDNRQATLNYSFENLSSVQQDQFLELSPSGTTIDNLPRGNSVTDLVWDITPAGFFTTSQEVLDALFAGDLYVRILSTDFPQGEIVAFIQRSGGSNGEVIVEEPLTETQVNLDVIRFLNQSTFGANEKSYNKIRAQISDNGSNRLEVYENWIDSQLDMQPTNMTDLMIGVSGNQELGNATRFERIHTFWTLAINSPDQLRHRLAQSLSEILVISDDDNIVRNAYRGLTTYWDMLASSGSSSYESLLGKVTRHTSMGTYLSYLKNLKEDVDLGTFPDENYAREIMQLFSFGLVHLHPDGSLLLDSKNTPIATYDNKVISEMARVFTGLSISRIAIPDTDDDRENDNFKTYARNTSGNQAQWTHPMRFFSDYHDFGEKHLFTDKGKQVVISARDATVEAAEQELDEVISLIVAHSSTAPRISRLLIQQLVTSNPSGPYVERVANAFGKTGDIRATIKAILLDQEARNPNVINVDSFGKLKSPLLQQTSFMRLTDVSSKFYLDGRNNNIDFINADRFDSEATFLRVKASHTSHVNLSAPSVFNFYSPDYTPPGELANRALVAPEMELLTETSLFDTINDFFRFIKSGSRAGNTARYTVPAEQQTVNINRERLTAVYDEAPGDERAKAAALVDYLDFYYNASQIALTNDFSGTRDLIIDAVVASDGDERLNIALYGIVNAPESLVQK